MTKRIRIASDLVERNLLRLRRDVTWCNRMGLPYYVEAAAELPDGLPALVWRRSEAA